MFGGENRKVQQSACCQMLGETCQIISEPCRRVNGCSPAWRGGYFWGRSEKSSLKFLTDGSPHEMKDMT